MNHDYSREGQAKVTRALSEPNERLSEQARQRPPDVGEKKQDEGEPAGRHQSERHPLSWAEERRKSERQYERCREGRRYPDETLPIGGRHDLDLSVA
jgi:hypothetical protein